MSRKASDASLSHSPTQHRRSQGLRAYHSDISLAPGGPSATKLTRAGSNASYGSDSSLQRSHSLIDDLDEADQHTCGEILVAAETLENLVNESVFVGAAPLRRGKSGQLENPSVWRDNMGDKVLKLVYGTMKYMPYIDTLLVKTQFLVYHNQFLNHLGVVKVMIYDLMKHHFNYHEYSGLDSKLPPDASEADEDAVAMIMELDAALREFQVKMAAAYARIRIERKASGNTSKEQMENVLPETVRQKEYIAVDMPKCLRVNRFKVTKDEVLEELEQSRTTSSFRTDVIVDPDFDDLLVVSPDRFNEIKASRAVTEGRLIVEDKTSFWLPRHVRNLLPGLVAKGNEVQVLDARAGCGTKALHLASALNKVGKVFACESRAGRLESLKSHKEIQGCKNLEIIEADFASLSGDDPRFADVSIVIVEPLNSGTGILDKLGYLLQEEEFPNEQYTQKDMWALKSQQLSALKHAFSFPNVEAVVYVTRSINADENEQVVREALESVGDVWELACVLPEVPVLTNEDYELEECLKILPSESTGNGIFIASFQHIPPEPETLETDEQPDAALEKPRRKRRKPHVRQKGELFLPRLPKALAASVNRLSVPRGLGRSLGQTRTSDEGSLNKSRDGGGAASSGEEIARGSGVPAAEGGSLSPKTKAARRSQYQTAIGVLGISLKEFYAPRDAAVKRMGAEDFVRTPSMARIVPYPVGHASQHSINSAEEIKPYGQVPNPKPWK
ncbi:putative 28S rRNA (cytosine-C(5))-methyltransferase [Geranomyces michiganensis]|nr:putative 28S rRNA (cytosine-C(5))-methyltransferase [Geranomyces michiganensis]